MSWEVSYIEGIEKDFIAVCFTAQDLFKLKSKMDFYANNPFSYSERVKGVPYELWRFKFKEYRVFAVLDKHAEVIHCLALIHRKECYNKVSLNRVLTLVRGICK